MHGSPPRRGQLYFYARGEVRREVTWCAEVVGRAVFLDDA